MNEKVDSLSFKPLMANRWKLKLGKIPVHQIRNFKFYNDNDKVLCEIEYFHDVSYKQNIFELFDLTEFVIEYLDPSGETVYNTKYFINGMNFEEIGDYKLNDSILSTTKLKLIVTNK